MKNKWGFFSNICCKVSNDANENTKQGTCIRFLQIKCSWQYQVISSLSFSENKKADEIVYTCI